MAETGQDADVYGGDDVRLDLTLLDRDGNALDLTGCSLLWGMAPVTENAASLRKSTDDGGVTITDAVAGYAAVTLDPADTANLDACEYRHEMKLTDADGNVETVMTGRLTIRSSILD